MGIQELLATLNKCSQTAENQWMAQCPAHKDTTPSLAISVGENGRILLHCHAGCSIQKICAALGIEVADLSARTRQLPGLTLEALAEAKRLPVDFLRECGVERSCEETIKDGVVLRWEEVLIRYFHEDGSLASRHRRRFALSGARRFAWTKQDEGKKGPGIIAYGLHKLSIARKYKYIVIVEGESDCWTLWFHGIPALGIPGATMIKVLAARHLKGIERVYVWKEPDEGGKKFVDGIVKRIRSFHVTCGIYVISSEHKDVSSLYCSNVSNFQQNFNTIIRSAQELASESQIISVHNLTDLGNAMRFAELNNEHLRYCPQMKKWFIWDGVRWDATRPHLVYQRVYDYIRTLHDDVTKAKRANVDTNIVKALEQHALATERQSRIEAIISLSTHLLSIAPETFNADPMLFNCRNGTVNLRTGELQPHNSSDYITQLAPINYDPAARAPRWERFLQEVTENNTEFIEYIQRVVGYTLTGHTTEQCAFILHGHGRNGKTVFLEVLKELFGSYARTAPASVLIEKTWSQVSMSNDVAHLRDARLAVTSETKDGERLDESQVKVLTSGDSIVARKLYEDYITFRPQFKLYLACNHQPRIRGQDEGIWSKLRLLPFRVYFSPERQDKQLFSKLCQELDGIFTWAVQGCLYWQQMGLSDPDVVIHGTEAYRLDMDVLGEFISECCVLHPSLQVSSNDLYLAYREWSERVGEHPQARRNFGIRLRERGLQPYKTTGGARYWQGISLKISSSGLDTGKTRQMWTDDDD